MIADCQKAGLPEPDFEQRGPHFVVILWRDWLTAAVLSSLSLNKRQLKAIHFMKSKGPLSSADYQDITGASRQTAARDLAKMTEKAVLVRKGKGRGTRYIISRNLPQK